MATPTFRTPFSSAEPTCHHFPVESGTQAASGRNALCKAENCRRLVNLKPDRIVDLLAIALIPNITNASALAMGVVAAQVCCPAQIRYAGILPAAYDTHSQCTIDYAKWYKLDFGHFCLYAMR